MGPGRPGAVDDVLWYSTYVTLNQLNFLVINYNLLEDIKSRDEF